MPDRHTRPPRAVIVFYATGHSRNGEVPVDHAVTVRGAHGVILGAVLSTITP
ncbi:hypothetical protein PISMIDRAFT_687617 [Pisolithus microcarpus 441]|uniref:Uncharacterized protein n=1 Tax=Pisolithus microcarpus 441 TaxID=765257 RepID=A0A0C9YLZ2_9AGAM|nr:hypothetical protein PISMIDRAFT_687617 [Pisolithus microcarpus 441]